MTPLLAADQASATAQPPLVNTQILTWAQVRELEKEGAFVKRGKFTKQEKDTIETYVNKYLQDNGLTRRDLEDVAAKRTEDKELISKITPMYLYVAEHLPGRVFNSVYKAVRRIYNPLDRAGKWSDEDSLMLVSLQQLHGNEWSTIAKELRRSADSCKDRFTRIEGTPQISKGPFTMEENEALRAAVAEFHNANRPIHWKEVAQKIPTRTFLECKDQWLKRLQNMPMPEDGKSLFTVEEDFRLCSAVKDLEFRHESDINWMRVFKACPGRSVWSVRSRWFLLKRTIPCLRSLETLDDILEYLLAAKRPKPDENTQNA